MTGDVTLATDADKLTATLKPNNVDPADLRITEGRIAGKLLQISDDVGSLVGVDAPNPGVYGTRILHDGALSGLAIVSASSSRASNATSFTTTEYLSDGATGEFHYELTATISGRSNTTIRFGGTGSAPVLEADTSGIVFASRLESQALFVLGGAVEGQQIAEWQVSYDTTGGRLLGQLVGTVRVYLVTQQESQGKAVRYAVNWDGAATVFNFNVAFNMKLSFLASDPGSGQTGNFVPVPSGIATGQVPRKTATGWGTYALPDGGLVPIPSGIATGQIVRRTATGWEAYTLPEASSGGASTISEHVVQLNSTTGTIGGGTQWSASSTTATWMGLPALNKIISIILSDGTTFQHMAPYYVRAGFMSAKPSQVTEPTSGWNYVSIFATGVRVATYESIFPANAVMRILHL